MKQTARQSDLSTKGYAHLTIDLCSTQMHAMEHAMHWQMHVVHWRFKLVRVCFISYNIGNSFGVFLEDLSGCFSQILSSFHSPKPKASNWTWKLAQSSILARKFTQSILGLYEQALSWENSSKEVVIFINQGIVLLILSYMDCIGVLKYVLR